MITYNIDFSTYKKVDYKIQEYFIFKDSKHKRHRSDGPAFESYGGETKGTNAWWFDGYLHRIGGPALTRISNGQITELKWYRKDKIHRLNAPAVIFPKQGKEYWEFNKKIK